MDDRTGLAVFEQMDVVSVFAVLGQAPDFQHDRQGMGLRVERQHRSAMCLALADSHQVGMCVYHGRHLFVRDRMFLRGVVRVRVGACQRGETQGSRAEHKQGQSGLCDLCKHGKSPFNESMRASSERPRAVRLMTLFVVY